MNIIKTSLSALAGVALFGMTSCLHNEEPNAKFHFDLSDDFSFVTDNNNGESTLLPGASYEWDYIVNTSISSSKANEVTITIKDLQLEPGGARIALELPSLPYTLTQDNAMTATVKEMDCNGHTITNFVYRQYMNTIGADTSVPRQFTYFEMSYTIDGRYDVEVLTSKNMLAGALTITNGDGVSTTTESPYYNFVLDLASRTATVTIYRVTIDGIYYSEINYSKIPFTVSSNEFVIETTDPITPTGIDQRKLDALAANNFRLRGTFLPTVYCTIPLTKGGELKFTASAKPLKIEEK